MNMIKALYYGTLNPIDTFHPDNDTHKEWLDQQQANYDKFEETLNKIDPELKKRFRRISEEVAHAAYLEMDDMFIHGFRYGANMMLEILYPRLSRS